MATTLRLSGEYNNPYEQIYDMLKSNPAFRQIDWEIYARRGQLPEYITLLDDVSKLPMPFSEFSKNRSLDLLDTDERAFALETELRAGRTIKKPRKEPFFNQQTGKEETRKFEMTDYEYNNFLLDNRVSVELEKIERQKQQERKDSLNGFAKFVNTIVAGGVELMRGAVDLGQDLASLVEGIGTGISYAANGKGFDDGFRAAFANESELRLFDSLGITDALLKWESEYTNLRDLDGNYTNVGKYLGGVTYSLGKALPSVAINLVGSQLMTAGSAATRHLASIATGLYYTGLGAGEFKELANNPNLAGVPSYTLMLNASIKTATEFLIQKGLSSLLGPSQFDKLVFGESARISAGVSAKGALIRIGKDAFQEGLEEYLQQYSNYVVDRFFAAKEQEFMYTSEWNLQTMLDAFLLGSLSVIGTTSFQLSKSVASDIVANVKQGGGMSMNFLKSWEFKQTFGEFSSEYHRIINDKGLSDEARAEIVGQMYITTRTIASVYGKIGQKRFDEATKMLEKMSGTYGNKFDPTSGQFTLDLVAAKHSAETLYKAVTQMGEDTPKLTKEERETMRKNIKELKRAKMTKVHKMLDADEVLDEEFTADEQDSITKKIRDVLKLDKSVKKVVVTEDGTQPVKQGSTLYTPIKYAESLSSVAITKDANEAKLVNHLTYGEHTLKDVIKRIIAIYGQARNKPKVTGLGGKDTDYEGDYDIEAITNFLFNPEFQRILLGVADRDVFQLIDGLETIFKDNLRESDALYAEHIKVIVDKLKLQVMQYLINQQEASLGGLQLLDAAQVAKVQEMRHSKDLRKRVLAGKKLSEADVKVLTDRVNYMNVDRAVKSDIVMGLGSNKKAVRQQAMLKIENYYRQVFNSPYDDKTYFRENGNVGKTMLNMFLKKFGITIQTFLSIPTDKAVYKAINDEQGEVSEPAILRYYQNRFKEYTENAFAITYSKGTLGLVELQPAKTRFNNDGYNKYLVHRNDIITGKDLPARQFVTIHVGAGSDLLSKVTRKLHPIDKAYINVKNVVYNPSLLSDAARQDVKSIYGDTSPTSVFLYLRKKFLADTGTITIATTSNGDIRFVDVRPMLQVLSDPNFDGKLIGGGIDASKVVKSEYAVGRLQSLKIKYGNQSKYVPSENIIYIDHRTKGDAAYLRFSLLHELQHAMQVENGLNEGISAEWMAGLPAGLKNKVIADIKMHRSDLFKGENVDEAEVAQRFVYDTSGESMAYGMDVQDAVTDFYPTLVRREGGKTTIVMPWGKTYTFAASGESLMLYTEDRAANEFRQVDAVAKAMLMPYDPNRVRKGFILPSGQIGFFDDSTIVHGEVMSDIAVQCDNPLVAWAYMNDAVQITNDVQGEAYVGVDNENMDYYERIGLPAGGVSTLAKPKVRTVKLGDSRYTVRMLPHMNWQQREAVVEFVDMLLATKTPVTLGDPYGFTLTDDIALDTPWEPNASDMLKQYGRDFARDRSLRGRVKSINGLQSFYGERYMIVSKKYFEYFNKSYNDVVTNIPAGGSGIISPDGEVGFLTSSDAYSFARAEKVAAKINAGMAEAFDKSVCKIFFSSDVNGKQAKIVMSRYSTASQIDALWDIVTQMYADGIKVKLQITTDDGTIRLAPDADETADEFLDRATIFINSASQAATGLQMYQHGYGFKDDMWMDTPAQSSDRITKRYVSQADAADTNLKYFVKKNRQIQLSPGVQKFIVEADNSKLDPELWSMIGGDEKGQLTERKVLTWFRTATEVDEYTFSLIRSSFFPDSPIKTFKQLETMANINMASYYALRAVLKKAGAGNIAYERLDAKKMVELIQTINSIPKLKALYEKVVTNFQHNKGLAIDIDYKNIRTFIMSMYDGSIESMAHVASIAKNVAIHRWKTSAKHQEVSIGSAVKGDLTYEDLLSDPDAQAALNDALSSADKEQQQNEIIQAMLENLYAEEMAAETKRTPGQLLRLMADIRKKITEETSDRELEQMYAKLKYSDLVDVRLSDEALASSTAAIVRPRVNVASNIQRIATTMRNNLNEADRRRFLKVHSDMFNDDMTLKQAMYVGKTKDELLELEDELRNMSRDVKKGIYKTFKSIDINEKYKETKAKLQKERSDRISERAESGTKTIIIDDRPIRISSPREMPAELKAIMETTFEKMYKTDVAYLSEPDQKHMQVNLKKFVEENAERLSQLTSQDLDDILEFYEDSFSDDKKYNMFKIYTLAYLYHLATDGAMAISSEQLQRVTVLLEAAASVAGGELAAWKSVIKYVKPAEVIIQSMARSEGLEFRQKDVAELANATRANMYPKYRAEHPDRLNNAIQKMYENGLKDYKGRKRSFFDRLWKFERLMMLSSPGTAIRNLSSNILVTVGNDVSSFIGNLFAKKHRKKHQYVISGTKIDEDVKVFVKENFLDSGLYDMISDGLTKYDSRKSSEKTTSDVLTEMIANKIKMKIFNENAFNSAFMNKLGKIVFKMLSDDPFIKRRTISYFGKMLTERREYINLNMSDSSDTKLYDMFADAYQMAAYDYMHKSNVFGKVEQTIRRLGGPKMVFVWKQLFPFATASWNWFLEGLNYTPVGLAKAIVDFARLEKTIEKFEAQKQRGDQSVPPRFTEYLVRRNIGKGILGSVGLLAGILLGVFGAAGIDKEDEKIKLRAGDVQVDVSGLFGTQSILLGIAMTNPWRKSNESDGKNFERAMSNIVETLFLDSTLQDMFNTFRGSGTLGDWLMNQPSRMMGMFVPNALKLVARTFNNYNVKYTSGFLGGFERLAVQSIPGFVEAMPKRIDPYTGKVQAKYDLPYLFQLVNSLSPVDFAKYEVSELEKKALLLGVRKSELTGKYDDIGALSSDNKNKLNKYYGELNNKSLTDFFNGKGKFRILQDNGKYAQLSYRQMTDAQRANVIDRIMSDNAKYAKIYTWTSSGGKYYATESEYVELKKLGITKNVYKENKVKKQVGFI